MNLRQAPLALVCLSLTFIFAPVSIHARQESKSTYESLLERVKKSDPTVDFAALRLAYADNPPKGSADTDSDTSKSMFASLRDKKYDKAIEYAEQILKGNYVDINAHMIAAIAYKEKKDAEKEKYHRYVAEGLVKSIINSGDGKSQETAFTVISTGEEYVILRVFGLMPGAQSLLEANGHHYDRLDALDPKTNKTVTLYFNIDRPFGALEKLFKN
jgi:Domain of unknown function (DUF4919)